MPVTRKLGPSPQGREADPAHIRAPITFPADSLSLPDAYARSLFEMSSELPPHIRDYAASNHYDVSGGTGDSSITPTWSRSSSSSTSARVLWHCGNPHEGEPYRLLGG